MGQKEHGKGTGGKRINGHLLWPVAASMIVGFLLIFLLASSLKDYSNRMIESQKDTYANIARNVAISIENEVGQTEQSLQFFVDTKDFNDALVTFTDEEKSWPLNQISLLFCVYYSQVIDNMIISTDEYLSSSFWSLKRQEYSKAALVSKNEFATMDIYLVDENPEHAYLGITVSNDRGYYVTAMLDLELMYRRLVSHIQIDPGTDILVKNSDGLIVMSSDPFAIGMEAEDLCDMLLEGRQGTAEQMLQIISHQGEGKEGNETFYGHWLYDEGPEPSKKLSVYVPAAADSGFFVVSAIIDYEEVLRPVQAMFAEISLLVVGISLVFIGLIVYLYYARKHKEEMEKENRYLRELNHTLQLVNENQRMKNHQQRLEIIGTMTCGIAHEFNNLLTPIMGYSGMLLAQKTEEDPEWDDVKEIFEASEKAKEIIQQISAFGRKNSDMTFHHISVPHFFSQVRKLAAGLMPATVRFVCTPPKKEYYLFGNTTQLTQVVLNLIVNSIDAIGRQKGQIRLTFHLDPLPEDAPRTDSPAGKTDTYGCICISDDGCGMDENLQRRIFTPFFTTKGKRGGSGLGLLISENIIDAHHGKIMVSSAPGEGTCFTLMLPLSEKPDAEQRQEVIPSLRQKHAEVLDLLLADEDPIAQRLFTKGLSRRGFCVHRLENSSDFLATLHRQPCAVMVVDDMLSQIPWPDVAIRARQHFPDLTIVLMASTIGKNVIDAVSTGILDGYVLKPALVSELDEEIRDVLRY
jgi:signal transduction histidine kinase